ncbi:non-functional NADPH-dependent codeinone reductase 2-like [Cornus florida]|uniref:non-functional NADPH-dependent codeinone reductase 2-like n=1 Tax=Cornus florida TaxID=4283 RepID=UPI00289E5846|nr:non-functional NADPH-dependent codeinone reductase 2-like [Cornus florida]
MGSSNIDIPKVRVGSSSIPLLGFGTAVFPFVVSETAKESILHAIKLGYRHFDTAANYKSEPSLGEAIAEALRLGLVTSRDELFITSKLWCSDGHRHRVLPGLQSTLQKLGLEYLDLFLIHVPVSLKPEAAYEVPFKEEDIVAMDIRGVWEGMEECQRLGLTKNIGVSNFSCKKLDQLLLTSKIPPMVNQVEMSPLWQQSKLREFCEKKGIHVTAYSPLGARGTVWGTNQVLDCEVLKEIAEARGKTVAQVALRWVYEQGVSLLVKSFNKERIKENLEIFDWTLSPEDCHKISQIPQQKGWDAIQFIWDEGPYKSIQEFWDEEV